MKDNVIILWTTVLLVFVVFLSGCTSTKTAEDEKLQELGWNDDNILETARTIVKGTLDHPSTANFKVEGIYSKTNLGTHVICDIVGKVDASNSFGAVFTYSYDMFLHCYQYPHYELYWEVYPTELP